MSFTEESYKSFELFNKDWALVTAGNPNDFNTMVIGWGELGTIWGKPMNGRPVVTVFVHPDRYTSEYLKKYDTFTVSFYDKKYFKALGYLGSHSGRDGDKVAASGLTPVSMGDGVTFKEAKLTFLCKKIYFSKMNKDGLSEEIMDYYVAQHESYPNVTPDGTDDNWEPHYVIIGEITETRDEVRSRSEDRIRQLNRLFLAMIHFDEGDPMRIQHFTKVHSYARLIAQEESMDEDSEFVLEAAAYVHDIGIHVAEEKYGHQDGKLQEQEGPAAARELMTPLGFAEQQIQRVEYLVGHHHTYTNIDSLDYQILVEADFLVNLYEKNTDKEEILTVRDKIFRTKTGIRILNAMFGLD